MRILVHSKFFDTVKVGGDEAYRLNRASRLLLRDEPTSMVPCVLALLDPVFVDIFQHTSEWLQGEDSSPFVTRHGRSVWEYAGFDQKWNKMFNEGMASDARLVTTTIALKEWKHVFEGMETMVDVAGGTGTVAGAIAAAFPGLRCTVLDLPHVVAGLQGSKNLSYISGDMFEFIPPADAVFLKWILHDWGDEDCLKILKNCKEAIRASKKGGKVIIVDMVVGDQKEDEKIETQLLIDVLMYYSSGRERTEKEWANLFLTAGFTTHKINSVLSLRSVIEVFP